MAFSTPSVTMTSTSGRYSGSGVNYTVTGTANYYLYVQDPTSYIWYRKGRLSSGGTLTGVNIGKNETGDTYYTYLVLSSTDLNASTTFGNDVLNYALSISVPLYICQIYKGSSTKAKYDNVTNPSLKLDLSRSDCEEVYGLSTAANTVATISSSSLSNGWSYFGPNVNGKTLYAVYKNYSTSSSATKYYYRGSSSKKSVTATTTTTYEYLYGTGSTKNKSTSVSLGNMTTTCLSDSSYTLQYWVTHPDYSSNNTPNAEYSIYAKENPELAFADGYSTIYGIYQKENVIKDQTNLTYYCGTNSPNTCTKTQKATGEYYGDEGNHIFVGDVTTTYSTIDSTCPVSGWEHIGWAYDATTQYATLKAENLFNSGYTTIYGTYKQTKTVTYYPQNGSTEGTSSIDDYRYGVGSVTNNIPQGPALTYDGYTFIGWATTEDGTADTWDNQCSNGARFLYAIWERDGNVYLGINDNGTKTWVLCDTYIGKKVNNVLQWVPMQMKVGASSNWN